MPFMNISPSPMRSAGACRRAPGLQLVSATNQLELLAVVVQTDRYLLHRAHVFAPCKLTQFFRFSLTLWRLFTLSLARSTDIVHVP